MIRSPLPNRAVSRLTTGARLRATNSDAGLSAGITTAGRGSGAVVMSWSGGGSVKLKS
ncbi:MAG TPA: hypothetical protein VIX15_11830 [Streptosporangiaceae bacterium]